MPQLNRTQYNEGGTIKREPIGINTLTKKFKFAVNTTKKEAIEIFLRDNLGKSFQLSFDGSVTIQPEIWRIVEYRWIYHSSEVIGISCEMVQVRRYRL